MNLLFSFAVKSVTQSYYTLRTLSSIVFKLYKNRKGFLLHVAINLQTSFENINHNKTDSEK